MPAFCHIASLHGGTEPLSLLDLGTSAGLNLLFDDYAYRYLPAEGEGHLTAGPADAGVGLECAVRGELAHLPELRPPAVAARVGLDVSPVDARSDDEARWLLACQWPDNPVRFANLRAALANTRQSEHPPRLETGDMIADLERVAGTIAGDGPLVVFHTWVAAYLEPDRQRALADEIRGLAPHRPVHHLYAESPFETPGLPTPPSPEPREGPDQATALVHIAPGAEPVRLADTHPHGYWIRWWLTRRVPTARPGAPAPPPRPD
jgi:hypothetical protein